MSALAKAFGIINGKIEYKGKSYSFPEFTMAQRAEYECWLENRALESIIRARLTVGEASYRDMLSAHSMNVAADIYAFGGRVFAELASTATGTKKLLEIGLRGQYDPADSKFLDDLYSAKLAEVVKAIQDANADPSKNTEKAM